MGETVLDLKLVEPEYCNQPCSDEKFSEVSQAFSAEGLGSVDLFIDRVEIESQAHELIASRSQVETNYKTDETYRSDSRTLLFEALTASGHLSEFKVTGTIQEIHSIMLNVILNSFNDKLPEHEQRRRFQELCEELTRQKFELLKIEGSIPWQLKAVTISDSIPEGALSERAAQSIGYRTSNKKGMVRDDQLIDNYDGTYTRYSEQISRSNADAIRSQDFLKKSNIPLRASHYPDVSVLGTQFIHTEDIVKLQQRLDNHQGEGIRYGELLNDLQIPYEKLREQSIEREHRAECYIDKLALYTAKLDTKLGQGLINEKQYEVQFKQEVKNILRSICVMDPSYAVDCFGEEAEAGFIKASNLTASGDFKGAKEVLLMNAQFEQTVSFCGMSLTVEEAKKMGLEVDSLADLLTLGKEQYGKKTGACRVEKCPSPRPTEIGGCSVCIGKNSCQALFDKGWSYERIKRYYSGSQNTTKTIYQTVVEIVRSATDAAQGKADKTTEKYQKLKKHEKIAA